MSIAPYVATPQSVVRRMLLLAEVKQGEMVYDLGCGDGRVVITAAQGFGARGMGVELKEDLARKARGRVSELGLGDRVRIVHGDLFDVDVGLADVVTLYLTTSANSKVKPKLERELKPGARVVSHNYPIRGWTAEKTEGINVDPEFYLSRRIYLYRIIQASGQVEGEKRWIRKLKRI